MQLRNRAISGLCLIVFLFSSGNQASAAFAQSDFTNEGKTRLMSAYQSLASMSDRQWTEALIDAARRFRAEGKPHNSEVLLNLTAPEMRTYTMDLIKSHLDDQSQNGLILFMGRWACWNFGCVIFALLILASFDGEQVENF